MLSKKLKIAIFHLAFVYSGGGERLVLEELNGLRYLGHKVDCFAPIINYQNCFPDLIPSIDIKKIIPSVPKWIPDSELLSIFFSCVLIPFYSFKFRKYDVYFGANQPGPYMAFLLSRINKKPYAIYLAQPTRLVHPRIIDQEVGLRLNDGFTIINSFRFLFKPLINYLDIKSIRNADIVFTNGSYMQGVIEQVYGVKSVNCPAGTYLANKPSEKELEKRFKGQISLNNRRLKKPFILLTNRHFPHKKFEYAIEALKLLGNKYDLAITGRETDYTRMLKRKHRRLDNVHFLGLLEENELKKVHENAAVYVYPAPEEDFGMGIIEAMAHSTPVVAWGNAGPTGIITHNEDGLLARPFSVKDFANCIDRLMSNKSLYKKISANARKKVEKYFTYEQHNKRIVKYLEKLVDIT